VGERPRDVDVAVAFSPDGERLVVADRSGMRFIDAHTGLEMQVPSPNLRAGACGIAFSSDSQQCALVTHPFLLTVLDVRPFTPEIRTERSAFSLLRYLFHMKLLSPEEAQESIRRDQTLSDAVRQKALALAQHYHGNARVFNEKSWGVVMSPRHPEDRYREALRHAEAACRIDPDCGEYLNTLGIAQYRVGQYQKALDTLLRSDRLNAEAFGGSICVDLAFIAMCHHQLGHREEAQVYLKRLRESIKEYTNRRYRGMAQRFLREAEELIEGKGAEPKR
jgi:tetratricopeptide (TPR) repeat protein